MHSPLARRRRRARSFGVAAVTALMIFTPVITDTAASARAVTANEAQAAASSMTLTKQSFEVGESIAIDYRTDRPHGKNWIAVYEASVSEPCSGCGFAWAYTPGESGSVEIPLNDRNGQPLPAGDYRMEYLYNDGWTRVSEPVPFTISPAAQGSTLVAASTKLREGEQIEVTWSTDAPHPQNWIGVYPKSAGAPDGDPASTQWSYAPAASGTMSFANLPAGTWMVYLLAQDGYTQMTDPVEVIIEADPTRPRPGDADAAVNIDPLVTLTATDGVIAREAFATGGAPTGWSIERAQEAAAAADAPYGTWSFTTRAAWTERIDGMRGRFARPLGAFAVADAQQFGGALDTSMTGAPVSVKGLGKVRLTFDSHYRGAPGQTGTVSVSFDGAEPTEVLRLDSTTVSDGFDARQLNYSQDITLDVPKGAERAVFSWRFNADAGGKYWAIDSVTVHQVKQGTDATPTQAWVMSDIQGHPQDWQHAIGEYSKIAPDADGMLLVGDIVNSGSENEWQEIYDVMDATADVRPDQTVAAIGNHERYAAGGFEANRDRFLAFADREKVWDEYVIEGPAGDLPVIVLGQEFANPSDVAMSDAQVEFLEQRLAHWSGQNKQVVVMTHFPLGDTVSASWIPGYHGHHQMNSRLTSILGNYPNAIVFTGHTHYPAEYGDWAMQRRTADGHADGFWTINTIAMHIEWDARGENTQGIQEVTTRDINQGLTLDSYGDRVVVTAHDFFDDTQLRQVVIPNPLVDFKPVLDQGTTPNPNPNPNPNPGTDPDKPGAGDSSQNGKSVKALSSTGASFDPLLLWVGGGALGIGAALLLLMQMLRRRANRQV